jgi:hypothetical protein
MADDAPDSAFGVLASQRDHSTAQTFTGRGTSGRRNKLRERNHRYLVEPERASRPGRWDRRGGLVEDGKGGNEWEASSIATAVSPRTNGVLS